MKNILIYSISLILILGLQTNIYGQAIKPTIDKSKKLGEATKSDIFEVECIGYRNTPTGDLDWRPTLVHKSVKIDHPLPGKDELDAMKAEKLLLKTGGAKIYEEEDVEVFGGLTPIVGEDFAGNPNNGFSPLDNSIAISNGGIIVSVANANIEYNTMTGTTTYSNSLVDFVDDPAIYSICDPVIIYDPVADRFIFFAQECVGTSSNSHLLIMFSQTNDPGDGWNYYKLTGDPLDDNSWFDYPKVAISDTELFITGNLFSDFGGFNESIVYQMEKADGYSGASMTWQYWDNISGSPFTLLAVSSGNEEHYGPGIYLVATNSTYGNRIKLYDITDAIAGSPTMDYYLITTPYYEVASDSPQNGTSCLLDNGDCRSLNGFYLDGTIHFVHQQDVGSGWNGISYNRLDVSTLTNTADEFGNAGTMDYSYPSIASFGLGSEDKSVLISFGSVSSSIYPQIRAVNCNHAMDWSETTLVKSSTSYASYTSPSVERWGDYTGTTRKYNAEEPSVWINGSYATGSHRWQTWIAELHGEYFVSLEENDSKENAKISPNPVVESFILSFETTENLAVDIQLIDLDGHIVKALYSGTAYTGINKFSFNKANLASGTYILQVLSTNKEIANEKIIIQ